MLFLENILFENIMRNGGEVLSIKRCFYDMRDEALDQIVVRKQEFLERFQQLLQNREFVVALKAGDPYSYRKRVRMTQKMLKEFL